ncbi:MULTISPECIES: hypothetical protein [unclassified Streptomyces]|uniref:hypothetical protein n=1 Tax=unclassified Streptomyces TaxID=2593676 RepID=UPI0015E1A08E|nr:MULTISPECIES: hypothetical protein [unclassified Streptomyces]
MRVTTGAAPPRTFRLALCATLLVAGCTTVGDSSSESDGAPVPAGSPSHATDGIDAPELRSGAVEFLSEGPSRGYHLFGQIPLVEGESWLSVNCRADSGARDVLLTVAEVGEFGIVCVNGDVTRSLNQLDLDLDADTARAGRVQFEIDAPETVEWFVSYQLPEGAELPD